MKDGNDIEKSFGEVIKRLRKQKGISQEKLAELSNLDRSYLSELERGEKTASLRTIFKLSNGLEVTADILLKSMVDN